MKIKKLTTTSHPIKLLKNLEALIYDSEHYLTNQNLGLFIKKDKKTFKFQPIDKYIKLFEKVDMPEPLTENIIPRRRALKKLIIKNKKNL